MTLSKLNFFVTYPPTYSLGITHWIIVFAYLSMMYLKSAVKFESSNSSKYKHRRSISENFTGNIHKMIKPRIKTCYLAEEQECIWKRPRINCDINSVECGLADLTVVICRIQFHNEISYYI